MNDHKWDKKELAPIAALLIFIAVVLILCAVSAGRDARAQENAQAGRTESEVQTEAPAAEGAKQETARETETETIPEKAESAPGEGLESGNVTEIRETVELEEELQAESITPVLAGEPDHVSVSENGVSGNAAPAGKKTNVEMLAEMMDYWSKGNVEAVEDLSGLSHYRAMSASLEGPSYFYYYGDRNDAGRPEGTGIAVYGGDQYYYGQWADGVRSGEGTWLKMYYYRDSDTEADRVLISHSYTGAWKNNLPNGEGHEQYGLDTALAEEGTRYWQNVMGNFQDGLYDGEMYIVTEDAGGNRQEWYGNATEGVFETFGGRDGEGRVPVCQGAQNPDSHMWIQPLENRNMGLTEIREQVTAGSGD